MEAPPVTVMPITSGTINMMEYLLQGSVLDSALESLLHRLRGLCDNMEPETFTDHELVYLLKGQQGNPFILRARRSLSNPTAPWHLRYLGQPEVGDKAATRWLATVSMWQPHTASLSSSMRWASVWTMSL